MLVNKNIYITNDISLMYHWVKNPLVLINNTKSQAVVMFAGFTATALKLVIGV